MNFVKVYQLVLVLNMLDLALSQSTKSRKLKKCKRRTTTEKPKNNYSYEYSNEHFMTTENQKEVESTRGPVEHDRNFNAGDDGTQNIEVYLPYAPPTTDGQLSSLPCTGNCTAPHGRKAGEFVPVQLSVKYKLYNLNCQEGEILAYRRKLNNTKWIRGNNLVVIIHGWLQSGEKSRFVADSADTSSNIKNAYIATNRSENIIIVNWAVQSNTFNYFAAAKDTYVVGQAIAQMMIFLKNQSLIEFSQVKIVGFSLGAHISGVVGDYIHEKYKTKIAEIIGLDPAGPLFGIFVDYKYRLDKSDASFVQIMHCNMGSVIAMYLGSPLASGHVDFYPNGGSDQPDCTHFMRAFVNMCSHIRCCELYASTLRGVEYRGCPCRSWKKIIDEECTGPPMGDLTPHDARGEYCLSAVPHSLDTPK